MLWDLFGNFADNPATQFKDKFVVNLVENHFVLIVNSRKPKRKLMRSRDKSLKKKKNSTQCLKTESVFFVLLL